MAYLSLVDSSTTWIDLVIRALDYPTSQYDKFRIVNNTTGDSKTWSDSSNYADGYNPGKYTSSIKRFSGLSPDHGYDFTAYATWNGVEYNLSGNIYWTDPLPPPGVPSSPPVITDHVAGGYTLSWGSSSGATTYRLKVRRGYDNYTTYYTTSNTYYTVTGLYYGVTYYVSVRAENSSGNSNYTSENAATTCPDAPSNLTFYDIATNAFSVQHSGMDGNYDYVKFWLYRGSTYITEYDVPYGSTTHRFTGLSPGVTYTVYASGFINISGTLLQSVNQKSQSVTTATNVRPSDWSWPHGTNGSLVAGASITSQLTATDWNNFTARINDFRQYKGLSNYSFTTAVSGAQFTAVMFNQALEAITASGMGNNTPTTFNGLTKPYQKVRGDECAAWDLNQLKNLLNSIT